MTDALTLSIAATLRAARTERGWSAAELAGRSQVSRTMIGKVERGEAQPTAVLLGRLSATLGLTLSQLVARAEGGDRRLARAADQPVWTDPDTGYRRRALSPSVGGPLELVEVTLPPGATVSYAAGAYAHHPQQIWVLDGRLRLRDGDEEFELAPGDCVVCGPPAARSFGNPGDGECRYLVALTHVV